MDFSSGGTMMKARWLFLVLIALSWDCEEVKSTNNVETSSNGVILTAQGACTEALVKCTYVNGDEARRCPFAEQKIEISRPAGNVSGSCDASDPICVCRCPQKPVGAL
jgi:hypothetical protein